MKGHLLHRWALAFQSKCKALISPEKHLKHAEPLKCIIFWEKKIHSPTHKTIPFISRSAGVKLHDWELFGKLLFNIFSPSPLPTLNGEPPSAPDIYPFRKWQLRAFLWSSSVPTTQQKVTLMTSLWLLFSPGKSAARTDCLPNMLSATNQQR